MNLLKYTLIGDGRSDKALINIINWLLNDLYPQLPVKESFADFSTIRNPPDKSDVLSQFKFAEYYYPFDILFYHRDAEKTSKGVISERKSEIYSKLDDMKKSKVVCIVPKTMMETWLLISESAIKTAAGNRKYSNQINIPRLNALESTKDSKKVLIDILKKINGSDRKFNPHKAIHLVAEYIEDYSPLRSLTAFQEFEDDVKTITRNLMNQKN